jgi:acetylornithine deacetylase/succinyl-diaminopimelate desuccinylase-like protein
VTQLSPEHAAENPAMLLFRLLRFKSVNPPGNEGACVEFLRDLLAAAGFETRLIASAPERPNLIARLPGRGEAPPLLFHGHLDVVPARDEARWRHGPFSGRIAEGMVWGRGAIDMKGGIAMMVAAALRARAEGGAAGDLLLALTVDEETGSDHGAAFLVRNHAEVFAGVRYAIGEFGGVRTKLFGRQVYPVQVAEKQPCWLRVSWRGSAGHGALTSSDGVITQLAAAVSKIERAPLPVHVTPVVAEMLNGIFEGRPGIRHLLGRRLVLDRLTRMDLGARLGPLVRNTATPTILNAGDQVNVVPDRAQLTIDARLLPGHSPESLIAELEPALGRHCELEVLRYDAGLWQPDMGLFGTLAEVLRQVDPGAHVVPMLMPAMTDGRFYARLGIQHYGFLPMRPPADLDVTKLIHSIDERIPIESVDFGTACLHQLLRRYRQV